LGFVVDDDGGVRCKEKVCVEICTDATDTSAGEEGGRIYFIRIPTWQPWVRKTWLTGTRVYEAEGLMETVLMGLAGLSAWNLPAF
jgi:hypothetical protein